MKKISLVIILSIIVGSVFSQTVQWSTSAVKKSGGVYELVIKASVPSPWHIYSQNIGEGGPVPTKFTYVKNPLVAINGKTAEKGNLKSVHDKNFNMDVKYYDGTVVFTQLVKVRGAAKTNISGSVEYMICNDHECLPPTKHTFSIKL